MTTAHSLIDRVIAKNMNARALEQAIRIVHNARYVVSGEKGNTAFRMSYKLARIEHYLMTLRES